MDKRQLERQFIEKVEASQGVVHKICRMYGQNEAHRKDLFQEIMIQLWKSYPSFRGESQFSSWMYRVALNVAIQDFRKVKKRKLLFFESQEFIDRSDIAYDHEIEDKFKQLHDAIRHLDGLDKAIVLLHLDGSTNEEIGEVVGISQNYVRVKMNRIKKKLSKTVKQNATS